MNRIVANKKALSNVITTLIILVVSVLLAGVVTMYAINITSTRTQQEELKLSKEEAWVYSNGTAFGALTIDNVGGRDVVIDKIQVRGVEAEWSDVYFLRVASAISGSLNCPNSSGHDWEAFEYTTGSVGNFSISSTDIPLASGDTLVVYVTTPDSLSLSDVGTTVGITVFTGRAQYYVETNVKSAEFA